MAASVDNYHIGKGVVTVKIGAAAAVDVGNVTEFEFTPNLETLDHFSSREGIRKKDKTVVISKGGTLRMVMDEITLDNFKLALLGADASGDINIFAVNAINAEVVFTGSNEVGNQFKVTFPSVDFIPSSSINFLSDEWLTVEVTGEVGVGTVGAVTNTFGIIEDITA